MNFEINFFIKKNWCVGVCKCVSEIDCSSLAMNLVSSFLTEVTHFFFIFFFLYFGKIVIKITNVVHVAMVHAILDHLDLHPEPIQFHHCLRVKLTVKMIHRFYVLI